MLEQPEQAFLGRGPGAVLGDAMNHQSLQQAGGEPRDAEAGALLEAELMAEAKARVQARYDANVKDHVCQLTAFCLALDEQLVGLLLRLDTSSTNGRAICGLSVLVTATVVIGVVLTRF